MGSDISARVNYSWGPQSGKKFLDTRLHPFVAIHAVRRLMANPDDTSQVFVIFSALRGRSGIRSFRRFRASDVGRRVLAQSGALRDILRDRQGLADLPPGSVGRTYFEFTERENLSVAGLEEASHSWESDPVPQDVELFRTRLRDAHDLTHVLTGYGRDPLGELCLLAFMNRHSKNLGQLLIVSMGLTRVQSSARPAVFEAWRNGAKARWFLDLDYEALLPRPLADVRHELNVMEPSRYPLSGRGNAW